MEEVEEEPTIPLRKPRKNAKSDIKSEAAGRPEEDVRSSRRAVSSLVD